jgi:hypothetical protein
MNLRKISLTKETVLADAGKPTVQPITRAVAIAVIGNPFAGRFVDDLSPLFEQGAELGQMVMKELVALLPKAAMSYGKAAIVGVNGEMEHGAAMIHPRLGQPMRDAIGGGQAIICSNVKMGGPGTSIDVPLGHKDNIWLFDHNLWHNSITGIVTAWNRILSQFQPYAHASEILKSGEDWLAESQTYLPFDPAHNTYLAMKYQFSQQGSGG